MILLLSCTNFNSFLLEENLFLYSYNFIFHLFYLSVPKAETHFERKRFWWKLSSHIQTIVNSTEELLYIGIKIIIYFHKSQELQSCGIHYVNTQNIL